MRSDGNPAARVGAAVPRVLPDRVHTWAQDNAAHAIVGVAPIGGGITNTKWLLRLADADPLVLRWSDPLIWGPTGREHVRREALACQLLAGSTLPVPQLVASDPDGAAAAGRANLLTWLPGSVRLAQLAASAITDLARVAVAVHQQPVPVALRPPICSFPRMGRPEVPGWARWRGLWRTAIDLWAAGPPPTRKGLLHRDFHLSNTLWQGDTVTGLIDWAETSWGAPDLDVAHMCSDFAMLGSIASVRTFRTAYLREGGHLDPDPDAARFWTISDILGFLPDPAHILAAVASRRPDLTAQSVRLGLEDLLAMTLS